MPIPARLLKRLEAFLAVKSRSQGGYAPVGEEDIQALGEILGGIIEAKYEKDLDGDVPVRFNLVDRTRFWNNSFFNIPYTREGDAPDIKALMEVVRVSEANLGMAQDGMKQSLRNLEYAMDHMKQGKAIRYGDQGFEAPHPVPRSQGATANGTRPRDAIFGTQSAVIRNLAGLPGTARLGNHNQPGSQQTPGHARENQREPGAR